MTTSLLTDPSGSLKRNEAYQRGRMALRQWYRYQVVPKVPRRAVRRLDSFRKRSLPVPLMVWRRLLSPGYDTSPLPGPSLAQVAEQNLDATVSLLEDAEVDYFLVENGVGHRRVVAVRETDRERVLAAMGQRWSDEPVYVGLARRDCLSFEPGVPVRSALRCPGVRSVGVFLVFRAYSTGSLTVADDLACAVEFWREDKSHGVLRGPRENRVSRVLPASAPSREVTVGRRTYRGIEPFAVLTPAEVDFPIDVVYTWVDGADPAWAARRDRFLHADDPAERNSRAADAARYVSRDELRYSMRSVEMFAPWARRIYLVTDDQTPPWLDPSHPRVRVVSHREIFTDPSVLPTFNSHAIESQLHHIPGLAEHYLYFNDDMLLGRPTEPTTFFFGNGLAKMFFSPAKVEYGPPSVSDLPATAAAKNSRALVHRDFGRYLTSKQKHAPYPHRRSILCEMEEKFREEFARTAASRFRHPADVSVASSFQQYYGFLTGRTVPSPIAYTYVDLSDPLATAKLSRIRDKRLFDAYCINDTDSDSADLDAQLAAVQSFLDSFYPVPATWERT